MVDMILAAAPGWLAFGIYLIVAPWKRRVARERDERAELIAFGESKGVEYVPGEDLHHYRIRVMIKIEALR